MDLYRLLGLNYSERVLLSIVYEIVGGVIVNYLLFNIFNKNLQSGYNASQLITQRDSISLMIKNRIQDKARDFFIDMDDVALVNTII